MLLQHSVSPALICNSIFILNFQRYQILNTFILNSKGHFKDLRVNHIVLYLKPTQAFKTQI